MLGIGAFLAGWISWGCFVNLKNDAQWRIPLGIQNLPALILAALILLFPESPRWLVDHDRADEGLRTLAKLHANGDISDPWVQAEFAQIQETISFEHEHEAKSYKELFVNPYVLITKLLIFVTPRLLWLTPILLVRHSAACSLLWQSRHRFK